MGNNMINTYDKYLSMPRAMTVEKMISIHRQITEEAESDPDAIELYGELVEAAVKYAAIRAEWGMMDREQKMEKAPVRTSRHNNVILQANVLARYLRQTGKPALWRNELGNEEEDCVFRKVIGDFACFIAFVNGICAR